jgi:MarR family transcriptional regulator, temperature-dependent positive regulator of motility
MREPRSETAGDAAPAALEQLQRLVFQFRGQLPRLSLAAGVQANPMELKALLHIAHHAGCTASDLVRHSGRDKAQVARLLQQLEHQGWLQRQPDAQDRRVQRLQLTPAGDAVHARMRQARDAWAAQLLARLSTQEQQQLAGLLAKLNGA